MELCFGQKIDPELGILFPWYTHGALDRIKSMDLSNKVVCEYGGGASTIWWANRAKAVYAVDHNIEWEYKVNDMIVTGGLTTKANVTFVPTREGDQGRLRDEYIGAFDGIKPNIVVIDGVHRYECAEYAVYVLKPEMLIIDNHQQDYVFLCPSLDVLLAGVRMERFVQENHTEHEGRPWATAIFYLNEKS
jgi:hypothetical protein